MFCVPRPVFHVLHSHALRLVLRVSSRGCSRLGLRGVLFPLLSRTACAFVSLLPDYIIISHAHLSSQVVVRVESVMGKHSRIEKQVLCQAPGCGRRFATARGLRMHETAVHAVLPPPSPEPIEAPESPRGSPVYDADVDMDAGSNGKSDSILYEVDYADSR